MAPRARRKIQQDRKRSEGPFRESKSQRMTDEGVHFIVAGHYTGAATWTNWFRVYCRHSFVEWRAARRARRRCHPRKARDSNDSDCGRPMRKNVAQQSESRAREVARRLASSRAVTAQRAPM